MVPELQQLLEHTNIHTVLDRPTLKDGDERIFRTGSVRERHSNIKAESNKILLESMSNQMLTKLTNDRTNTTNFDLTTHCTEWKSSEDEEFQNLTKSKSTKNDKAAMIGLMPQHGSKIKAYLHL